MRKIIPQKFYYAIAPGALTGFSRRAPENNSKIIFSACNHFDSGGNFSVQNPHLRGCGQGGEFCNFSLFWGVFHVREGGVPGQCRGKVASQRGSPPAPQQGVRPLARHYGGPVDFRIPKSNANVLSGALHEGLIDSTEVAAPAAGQFVDRLQHPHALTLKVHDRHRKQIPVLTVFFSITMLSCLSFCGDSSKNCLLKSVVHHRAFVGSIGKIFSGGSQKSQIFPRKSGGEIDPGNSGLSGADWGLSRAYQGLFGADRAQFLRTSHAATGGEQKLPERALFGPSGAFPAKPLFARISPIRHL